MHTSVIGLRGGEREGGGGRGRERERGRGRERERGVGRREWSHTPNLTKVVKPTGRHGKVGEEGEKEK